MLTSFITLALLLLGIFVYYFIFPKEDIIDTSETNILVLAILFILTAWVLITGLFGFQLLYYLTLRNNWDLLRGTVMALHSLLMIMPFLSIIYFISRFYPNLFKKFKIMAREQEPPEAREYRNLIRDLSMRMGIKQPPQLKFSSIEDQAPIIIGLTKKKTYLVLPINIRSILEKTAGNKESIIQGLKEFIFTHELSHILNRDISLISFTRFYLTRHFPFYWLLMLLALQVYSRSIMPGLTRGVLLFNWAIILPLVMTLMVLRWMQGDIILYRENYADARTSLFMDEKKIRLLTGNGDMERLFQYFQLKRQIPGHSGSKKQGKKKLFNKNPRMLNLGESPVFIGIRQALFNLFKVERIETWRIKNMGNREFIYQDHTVPGKRISAYQGISTAILYYICFFVYNLILKQSESMIMILFMITVGYIATLFITPLRNTVNKISAHKNYIKKLVKAMLMGFLFFLVFFAFLLGGFYITKYINPRIFHGFLFYGFNFSLMLYPFALIFNLLFSSTAAGEKFPKDTLKDMFSSFLGVITILLAFAAMDIYLFSSPHIISTATPLIMGLIITFTIKPMGGVLGEHYLSFNWYNRTIQKDMLKMEPCTKQLFIFFFGIFFGFFIFVLPALPFYGIWHMGALGQRIPQDYQSILILSLILVMGFLAARQKPRTIDFLKGHILVYQQLEAAIPAPTRAAILDKLEKARGPDGGYQSKSTFTPYASGMLTTTSGLYCRAALDKKEALSDPALTYILSCRIPGAGFALFPGTLPRLKSTFLALGVLKKIEALGKIKAFGQEIAIWIAGLQEQEGYFSTYKARYPPLEETFYALSSLHILGESDRAHRHNCRQWLNRHMAHLPHSIEQVYWLAKSMDLLGNLAPLQKALIHEHYYILEKKALNLHIDTWGQDLARYIELLDLLGIRYYSRVAAKLKNIILKNELSLSIRKTVNFNE